MKTLLLIDANSLIHRAFHALPPFTSKNGTATHALYGVASILIKIWREEKPAYAAALFDRNEPTFREEHYSEYKANRAAPPDELSSQLVLARELFPAFSIKTFEIPGLEADDLIATLATRFGEEKDLRIMILTGDMDTLQLVRGEKVVVRAMKKGVSETILFDEKTVLEKYGLEPRRLIDYKALIGDSSDNIKGVPGIGPKTALNILKASGDIEKALTAGAWAEKLAPHKEKILLSRKLVRLIDNAPITPTLAELAVEDKKKELIDYLAGFGFKSLISRIEGEKELSRKKPPKKQGTIF